MLNSMGQKFVVEKVYNQIKQLLLCIKGNCTDDTEAEAVVLEAVSYETCSEAVDGQLESRVFSMVKSDADGIGTLLLLLNDLKIDIPFRDQRFEEMAQEFSNLVE